jgi:uncharacterized membrane protein
MSAAEESAIPFGPVQMLVVGFADPKFNGEILAELTRLRDADIVRLIDLMVVAKDEEGDLVTVQTSDLSQEEATQFGALVGALVGLGTGNEEEMTRAAIAGAAEMEDGHLIDEADVWYLADEIPPNTACAVALIEHRWAIPLRDKILKAGGLPLADEWIHPRDLIAIGYAASAEKAEAGA